MNGTTRLYRPSDDDAIISVWLAASQIAHPFFTDAFFADEERKIREVYLPNAETWVFEQQATIVGFVASVGDEVGGLFVHPNSQRLGIGTALMDLVVNRRGEVFLDVFKANEIGRAFYDRYGFVTEREHIHEDTGHPQLRLRYRAEP